MEYVGIIDMVEEDYAVTYEWVDLFDPHNQKSACAKYGVLVIHKVFANLEGKPGAGNKYYIFSYISCVIGQIFSSVAYTSIFTLTTLTHASNLELCPPRMVETIQHNLFTVQAVHQKDRV
jgi:hypothetical protein